MVHTVGILGANGRIGGLTLPHLVKAHNEGKISLIVFTRPGSSVKGLHDPSIEVRELNLDDSAEKLGKVLKGVNVLLTALSVEGAGNLNNVVDALKASPDAVTFIPSRFGARFDKGDFADIPSLEPMGTFMDATEKYANEVGMGITVVYAGAFHDYFFGYNFVQADVKGNKVQANAKQLKNPFPITNTEDLAAGLAKLLLEDPESIKNKSYSFVSHWVSGNDIIETFTKIHGSKTEVSDYSEEDKKATQSQQPFGPVVAGYKRHWELGPDSFKYENQQKVSGRSFEQTARDALKEMSTA